jgi:hypothetical protein
VLDLIDFTALLPKGANGYSTRKIKHLARLAAAYPQCYPQKPCTAQKPVLNHALAGFFES